MADLIEAEIDRLRRFFAAATPLSKEFERRAQRLWEQWSSARSPDLEAFHRSDEHAALVHEEAARAVPNVSLYLLDAMNRLRRGDASATNTALAYLSFDKVTFGSGYQKERFLRLLKRIPLTGPQTAYLRDQFLRHLTLPLREYSTFVRLVPRFASPELTASLRRLLRHDNAHVRERARRLLDR